MRAALYLRVSTRDKDQTTDNQRPVLEKFCVDRGFEAVRIYEDTASAYRAVHRPGYEAMMEAARRRQFDIVVFWALDRFSCKGARETLQDLHQLGQWGVGFLSYQESYLDSLGPFGEAVLGLLATVAKMERQRISERVKAGIARAKGEGRKFGRKRVEIDEEGLKRATEEGWSVSATARAFNVSRATVLRRRKELLDNDS